MIKMPKQLPSFLLILPLLFAFFISPALAEPLTDINAPAAILVDTSYDTILFEKNAQQRRALASITKVMTALMVLEALERGQLQEDTLITASDASVADITKDSSTQNIKPGEQMSVKNLLYCLLVPSANEAANILAEAVSGSIPAFVEAMNARAGELLMENTHFVNPHGLDATDHYSSAYDIHLMVKEAMGHPLFLTIVDTGTYTVPATNLAAERTFSNTNALVASNKYPGYLYNQAIGVKTGNTTEAGYCLASAAQKNERTLVAVVLGAENVHHPDGSVSRFQFSESKKLLRWGFDDFKTQRILSTDTLLQEVPVKNGKSVSHVVGVPAHEVEALLPTSYDPATLYRDVTLNQESVSAPVSKGQVLGSIDLSYNGQNYGRVDLVAATAVEYSVFRMITGAFLSALTSVWLWLGVLLVFVFIVLRYVRALGRTPRGKRPPESDKIFHIDKAKPYDRVPSAPRKPGASKKSSPSKKPPR